MLNRRFYLDECNQNNIEQTQPFIFVEVAYNKDANPRGYYLYAGLAEAVRGNSGYAYNRYSFNLGQDGDHIRYLLKEVKRASKKAETEADEKAESLLPMLKERFSRGRTILD